MKKTTETKGALFTKSNSFLYLLAAYQQKDNTTTRRPDGEQEGKNKIEEGRNRAELKTKRNKNSIEYLCPAGGPQGRHKRRRAKKTIIIKQTKGPKTKPNRNMDRVTAMVQPWKAGNYPRNR